MKLKKLLGVVGGVMFVLFVPGGFLVGTAWMINRYRSRARSRQQIGQTSTFHALITFDKLFTGELTLEQYRKTKSTTEVKPIYSERKDE